MGNSDKAHTKARIEASAQRPQRSRVTALQRDDAATKGARVRRQFEEKNIQMWKAALGSVFGSKLPATRKWTGVDEICAVLSQLGAPSLNCTYLPEGGWLELTKARRSHEAGCIELLFDHDGVFIVRPRSLAFQAYPPHWSMSYFRLELDALEPTNIYPGSADPREELIEVAPGKYESLDRWNHDVREPGWRPVTRHLRGTLVMFAKASPYHTHTFNEHRSDALHDRMSATKFSRHVSQLIRTAVQAGVSVP